MVTSKQDLKKYIRRIESEVANVAIPLAYYAGVIDEDQADEAFKTLAALTIQATTRLNITFDKTPKAFDTPAAYKKARREYFNKAYNKAIEDYENGINDILSVLNKKDAPAE